MKVLWLVNYPLAEIAEDIKAEKIVNEGWLIGLSIALRKDTNIKLFITFPFTSEVSGQINCLEYHGYKHTVDSNKYDPDLKNSLAKILKKIQPDVIHLMGSEFPHCWSMVEAAEECGIRDRILVSIQGLISVYAKKYIGFMPEKKFFHEVTIRDFLKHTSLPKEQKEYANRGLYERKTIKNIKYVMGRTEWDFACTRQINPEVHYFHGGETLRPSFYSNNWKLEDCERHTIFISQATYPIKGFHLALEALHILVKFFSDCKMVVASAVPYAFAGERPRWRNSQYTNYICDLIKKYELADHLIFVGSLQEEDMVKHYLKCNVYVSPSVIENSSNSIGEAMLLGVPVVASDVGGTSSIMTQGKDGYLYPADEPYMLAHYVAKIFDDDEVAENLSHYARLRGKANHNPEVNCNEVIDAYTTISGSTGGIRKTK